MTPNSKLPPLPEQTAFERMNDARAMLVVHGFLTEHESMRVKNRLKQWAKKKSNTESY